MLCWPRGLSSRRRNASTRKHNNDSIELKFKTAVSHFGFFMRLSQQVKKGVTVLVGVSDSSDQEEIRLQLYNLGEEEDVWNVEIT